MKKVPMQSWPVAGAVRSRGRGRTDREWMTVGLRTCRSKMPMQLDGARARTLRRGDLNSGARLSRVFGAHFRGRARRPLSEDDHSQPKSHEGASKMSRNSLKLDEEELQTSQTKYHR